jgi:hypothetical protein
MTWRATACARVAECDELLSGCRAAGLGLNRTSGPFAELHTVATWALQVQSEGSLRTAYETLNEFIVFCRDTAAKVRPVVKHQYLMGNTETCLILWPCLN